MPWRKIALAAAAAAMLLLAYRLGAFEAFGDPARLKQTLLRLGALGWLAYLVAFSLLQPFGLPGVAFIVAASLVWPPLVASALSLVGSTVASVNGFWFARYLGREWVERRIPARLRGYDERLATRGFATVFALRLVLWMNPALHAVFGLSRVRFSTHLAASALAYVVPVVAVTFLGDAAFGLLRHQPASRWIAAGAIVAVVAAGWALWTRRRRRGTPRAGDSG